jgi:hypothetical protein
MQFGLDWTARALRRTLVLMSFAPVAVVPVPTLSAQRVQPEAGVCKAQGTVAKLEVHCPTATVTQLLTALREATGLRSHYAQELATARVSVTYWRGSVLELLEGALSAFNFVLWTDEGTPAVTSVSIIGMRGEVEGAKQPARPPEPVHALVGPSQPYRETPTPFVESAQTSVVPPDGEVLTAETQESSAPDDTPAIGLEPPPDTGNLLMAPTAGAAPLEPVPVETEPEQGTPGIRTQP